MPPSHLGYDALRRVRQLKARLGHGAQVGSRSEGGSPRGVMVELSSDPPTLTLAKSAFHLDVAPTQQRDARTIVVMVRELHGETARLTDCTHGAGAASAVVVCASW